MPPGEPVHHHYIDRFAYQDSPVHRLDPRAKVIAVVAYSGVLISLGPYTVPPAPFLIFPAALLLVGRIPLGFVFKHILLTSAFIGFMVLLAPVFDATPVDIGDGRTIRGGWLAALSILVRFVLGMGALIALASTTRFPELLAGLERLRVPHLLVTQLRFLYRYLFVLLDQAMHLRQARVARDAGLGPSRFRRLASAGQIGVLFVRTLEQAERMHLAMVARGYDGTIRLLRPLRWQRADTLFLLATAVYLYIVRWGLPGVSAHG